MPPPTLNSEEPKNPDPSMHCCGAVVFFLTVLDPAKLIGYDRPMLISGSVFMRPLTSR